MEEAALGVEHDGLAAGAETGVDGEGAFAAERRGEHEFAQVFREDPDRGFIGAFFSEQAHFRFHGGHEQALAAVLGGEADLLGAPPVSGDPCIYCDPSNPLQRYLDAHEKERLLFAAPDRKHAVGGDGFERLGPLKVVAVFRGVGFGFLAIHDLGGNGGLLLVNLAHLAAQGGVVGNALGEDVARTGQRSLGVGQAFFGIDVFRGFFRRVGVLVFEKEIGKRREPALGGHGGAGLALRAVGGEEILERGECEGGVDFRFQVGAKKLALIEGFQDGGAAGIELGELEHAVADRLDLDFVEHAGGLFPVAGDERDGRALGEKLGGRGDRGGTDAGLAGDEIEMGLAGRGGCGFGHGKRGGVLRPTRMGMQAACGAVMFSGLTSGRADPARSFFIASTVFAMSPPFTYSMWMAMGTSGGSLPTSVSDSHVKAQWIRSVVRKSHVFDGC